MNIPLIFAFVWIGMIAMGFWESSVEGRNAWDKKKLGWKFKIGKTVVSTRYHFWINIMIFAFLSVSFAIYGWDLKLFGVLVSAFFIGMTIEDITWYIVNPAVRFKEFYSSFSDYYPWIRISGKKIVPWGYVIAIVISILSWYFLWR